jgi:hypothetical protein
LETGWNRFDRVEDAECGNGKRIGKMLYGGGKEVQQCRGGLGKGKICNKFGKGLKTRRW